MNYIVLCSYICVTTYMMYVFHESFLGRYRKDNTCISSYFCLGVIGCFLFLFIPKPYMSIYMIGYMIIIPVYMYYGNENGSVQLFHYDMLLLLCVVLSVLLQYLFSIVPDAYCNFEFITNVMFFCMYGMLMLCYLQRKLQLYQHPYIGILLVGLGLLFIFNVYTIGFYNIASDHILNVMTNGLLLMMLSLFRMLYAMEVGNENILKLTVERYANKENKEKFETIEKENKMIMQQLHDMKKHLQILDEMPNSKKEFQSYKEKIEQKANEIIYMKQTGNVLIDHILQTYRPKLHALQIQCNIEVDDIDFSFMDTIDVSAIILNLLDNAIESCEKCEERFLLLKIKRQHEFVIFKMKNSCNGIIEENGVLKTTKIDHVYHGYGLRNMSMLANKYEGELKYHYDTKNQIFITSITVVCDHIS